MDFWFVPKLMAIAAPPWSHDQNFYSEPQVGEAEYPLSAFPGDKSFWESREMGSWNLDKINK